jgi:hypothetical protein
VSITTQRDWCTQTHRGMVYTTTPAGPMYINTQRAGGYNLTGGLVYTTAQMTDVHNQRVQSHIRGWCTQPNRRPGVQKHTWGLVYTATQGAGVHNHTWGVVRNLTWGLVRIHNHIQ